MIRAVSCHPISTIWPAASRRGPIAPLPAGLLRTAETPYALAMRVRNWAYDRHYKAELHVDVPVISVGNLTLGRHGQDAARGLDRPLAARARRARDPGQPRLRSHATTRSTTRLSSSKNGCPTCRICKIADRVAAARTAIEEFDCQAIVLDDGFQHRRLARDLDIVLLDACEPFGFGHVFPRGLLREPICGLSGPHVVVLSRADMARGRQACRDSPARVSGMLRMPIGWK